MDLMLVLLIAGCVACGTLAFCAGLMSLRNGLRIIKGRRVVGRLHLWTPALVLTLLLDAAFLVVGGPTIEFGVALFCAGIVLGILVLWFADRLSSSLALLAVHNVDYDSAYQAVLDVLDELGIDYDKCGGTITLWSLGCHISLRGWYGGRTVGIRFAGRDRKPVAAEVLSRLKSMPVSDSVGGYSSSAYVYLGEALFMFALAGVIVAVFLRSPLLR